MRVIRKALFAGGGVLLIPVISIATPPFGILSNVFPSQGRTARALHENLTVRTGGGGGEDGDHEEDRDHDQERDGWELILHTSGRADIYSQDIVIAPGGYSGWHSHPGLFIGTVKEGAIDWYDQNCVKHTFTAGESFTESNKPHTIVNSGSVNTRLINLYIIKAGEPRRTEDPQPPCGALLGLL